MTNTPQPAPEPTRLAPLHPESPAGTRPLAGLESPAAEQEVDADTGHRCQVGNAHGNQGKGGYDTYEVRIGGFGPSFRSAGRGGRGSRRG